MKQLMSESHCIKCHRSIGGNHFVDSGYHGYCAEKRDGRWVMVKWRRRFVSKKSKMKG